MSQWFFQLHLTKTVPRSSSTVSLRQLNFLLELDVVCVRDPLTGHFVEKHHQIVPSEPCGLALKCRTCWQEILSV